MFSNTRAFLATLIRQKRVYELFRIAAQERHEYRQHQVWKANCLKVSENSDMYMEVADTVEVVAGILAAAVAQTLVSLESRWPASPPWTGFW